MRIFSIYRYLEGSERKFTAISAVSFGLILCSYTTLRPIRDELGIAKGVENLHWSFLLTLAGMTVIVPLFGWLSSIVSKRKLVPALFLLFVVNLVGFSFLLKHYSLQVVPIFFSWVSVYNLTSISLFWMIVTDSCSEKRGKMLFGPIAAGGSIGAFLGPVITSQLIRIIEPQGMTLLSAFLLFISVVLINKLPILDSSSADSLNKKVGGGILYGLTGLKDSPFLLAMAVITFLGNVLGTLLYFRQADLLASQITDPIRRTEVLSYIDLGTNSLSLFFQLVLTPLCLTAIRPRYAFSIIPIVIGLCFLGLGLSSAVVTLIAAQIIRRAIIYSLSKPVESLLYSIRSDKEAYKGRNFIDTFVYRLGDTSGASILGFVFGGVVTSGAMFSGAIICIFLSGITYALGKEHEVSEKENLRTASLQQ